VNLGVRRRMNEIPAIATSSTEDGLDFACNLITSPLAKSGAANPVIAQAIFGRTLPVHRISLCRRIRVAFRPAGEEKGTGPLFGVSCRLARPAAGTEREFQADPPRRPFSPRGGSERTPADDGLPERGQLRVGLRFVHPIQPADLRLARTRQRLGRGSGQSASQCRSSGVPCSRRQRLDHRQSSARFAKKG
jgi:hypothetical protein